MSVHDLKASDLANFTGIEYRHRHGLVRHITYTEGVKYMADHGGAYWLIDKIATLQLEPKIKKEEFQFWKLKVKDNSATLTCDDGNENIVYSEHIEFTDFPLEEIRFYCTDNVILLPSEY
jgi:hypothetical protein